MKKSLGDRMKDYENITRNYLTRRIPVVLRIDGKAFHTYTKNFERPFDKRISDAMCASAEFLMSSAQGSKIGYLQSDECSIILTDYDTLDTDAWFGYNVQKMCSVTSSIFTATFNHIIDQSASKDASYPLAHFDCRAFSLPEDEIQNYLLCRQKDWIRNSITGYARVFYSEKELHGKKIPDIHEMLCQKNKNWNDLDSVWKNGTTLYREIDPEGHKSIEMCNIQFSAQKEFVQNILKKYISLV